MTVKTAIPQTVKTECVQRITLHGSPVHSCAKRYGVSEATILKWVKAHENGKLIKRHGQWSPAWDNKDVIQHFVDLDVLMSIQRGKPTYEDSILSLFDPELDAFNGVAHVEWSNKDILKLCLWMVDRSLELIRDTAIGSRDFNEELAFIESPLFNTICKAFGYDADELREGVYEAIAEKGKQMDDDEELRMQRLRLA